MDGLFARFLVPGFFGNLSGSKGALFTPKGSHMLAYKLNIWRYVQLLLCLLISSAALSLQAAPDKVIHHEWLQPQSMNQAGFSAVSLNTRYHRQTHKLSVQSGTSVAMGSEDQGFLIWTQQSPSGVYVVRYAYVAEPEPAGWEYERFQLSHGPVGMVKSAMNTTGDAVIAWVEHNPRQADGSTIGRAVYSARTGSWSTTHYPFEGARGVYIDDQTSLDVAIDEQGNAMLLWPDQYGLAWSDYDAETASWGPSQRVMGGGNYEGLGLDLTASGIGIATWSFNGVVFISHFDLIQARWSVPHMIGFGAGPDVALDNAGNCLVLWQAQRVVHDYQCNDFIPSLSMTGNNARDVSNEP